MVGFDELTSGFRRSTRPTRIDRSAGRYARIAGPTLPFPYSSAIKGSKIALRELRVQSQGRPLRVFYAFDPTRQAVLLVGGDKTGDGRFYERMISIAEHIWAEYLWEIGR